MIPVADIFGAAAHAYTLVYGIHLNQPFPNLVIEVLSEPFFRLLSYLLIYWISEKNAKLALALLIPLLLVHIDLINLASKTLA